VHSQGLSFHNKSGGPLDYTAGRQQIKALLQSRPSSLSLSLSLSAEFAKPDLPEWLSLARLIEAAGSERCARLRCIYSVPPRHIIWCNSITNAFACAREMTMMMMLLIAAAHLALHNLCANSASHQHRRRVHKASRTAPRRVKQSSPDTQRSHQLPTKNIPIDFLSLLGCVWFN